MQNESEVVDARPDMELLSGLDGLITHISAMGEKFDRVSSSFAPKLGVAEDRVCDSGCCHLVPFWAKELGKSEISAFQASKKRWRDIAVLEMTARLRFTLLVGSFYKFKFYQPALKNSSTPRR